MAPLNILSNCRNNAVELHKSIYLMIFGVVELRCRRYLRAFNPLHNARAALRKTGKF